MAVTLCVRALPRWERRVVDKRYIGATTMQAGPRGRGSIRGHSAVGSSASAAGVECLPGGGQADIPFTGRNL
jgi:hypothetical protein